jgi:uncharacterized protein (TIGR03382 family)
MKRFVVLFLALAPAAAFAFPDYPGKIPNGSDLDCANCHLSPAGGGARTAFGEDVRDNRDGSSILWNNLFNLDSDGDGQTNGQELNDPCGVWSVGDADPGGDVSNPGDDADSLDAPPDNGCEGVEPAPPPEGGCSATTTSTGSLFALLVLGLALIRRRK